MADFNWNCPHCDRAVTISDNRLSEQEHKLPIKNNGGPMSLISSFIVCPNPDCGKITLTVRLFSTTGYNLSYLLPNPKKVMKSWQLIPSSSSKVFPDYIPQAIRDDYREACLIKDLSPKVSATLSRRCLQGILRDFWKVKPGKLAKEIEEVQPEIDSTTWKAIDAVRTLGNIGAHMEKDIDTIVDVDPNEAELLIGLIETLLREWYINREERKARMDALIKAAADKKT